MYAEEQIVNTNIQYIQYSWRKRKNKTKQNGCIILVTENLNFRM